MRGVFCQTSTLASCTMARSAAAEAWRADLERLYAGRDQGATYTWALDDGQESAHAGRWPL